MDNKYLGSILNLDKWILKLDSKFHIFVCTVFHGNSNSFLWISSGVCNTVKINFDLILVSGSAAASPGILLKFQVLEPHLDLLNQKLQGWGPVMLFFFFFSSTSLLLPTHLPPPSCICAQPCNPMDCSSPGSSVHELFQTRILEWVAISFSTAMNILRITPRGITLLTKVCIIKAMVFPVVVHGCDRP